MSLDLVHVNKFFVQPNGQQVQVLDSLDFKVGEGETCAIIGQSGSGKTTLLSLIGGLDRPDAGRILLDGQDLAAMSQDKLARFRAQKIGIIFQQFHLMPHLTAWENISLPLEIHKADHIQRKTDFMLEQVGLSHRRDHLPGQMSGGECQRVAIARALVIRPSLLLADEPTGNLDTGTGKIVADLLFDLVEKEGKSLVLVTHNPELAARCSRVLRLENKRLVP